MTIEWMPRSRRAENGWRDPVAYGVVPVASRDQVEGAWGVRVPVRGRRFRWRMLAARPLLLVVILVNGWYVTQNLVKGRHLAGWSVWMTVATALVAVVLTYGALRLQPFRGRGGRDIGLTPIGLHTAGLFVPWSEVQEVVRFNFIFGPGRGGPGARNFLAVRVRDFVGVGGLSPATAGLANLTRRHLLVLAEARELHAPKALSRALERLIADPASRELLAAPEGVHLVDEGPPAGPSL